MPLEEKKYDVEANNDWAKNVKEEHIFIDSAESGRKGYYCIGCNKQMEAVIRKKNPNHRSYFRHISVDVAKDETPCTFSNREYRELLATDVLQRLKTIKVPNVYKYPPKGTEGVPMLLEKATFITAYKVRSQITFFEDIDGAVKFGKNPDVEERYLLIKPDVVFFDLNDKPILFIELVITHKVTDEKRIKLRRLGIDTISIIVPKSSEQEIEDNFKTTKRVKWEYNGIEANTKYVRVSTGASEGVLELDEQQRRIFEESYSCRKIRINNTIRTIKKCLGAESYRRVEYLFEQEISRIESATKRESEGLDAMERRYDEEVFSQIAGEFEQLEFKERKFKEEEDQFRAYQRDLEDRYFAKDRELRDSEEQSKKTQRELSQKEDSEEAIRNRFEANRGWEQTKFESRRRLLQGDIAREGDSVQRLKETREGTQDEFERLAKEERKQFKKKTESIRLQEENIEKLVRENFDKDLKFNSPGLPKRIRTLLEVRGLGDNFKNLQRQEESYKRAREFFQKGTWKSR